MFNQARRDQLIIGWIPVLILAALMAGEFVLGITNTLFNEPFLSLALHFVFIFCVGVLVAFVSARAYLLSGSLNILLLGIASLMVGVPLMVAQWAITPGIGFALTVNAAVAIANIGMLLSSVLLLMSATLLWTTRRNMRHTAPRMVVLGASYLAVIVMVAVIVIASANDLFPVFFISGTGSTLIREVVLTLSIGLDAISGSLFGWKYLRAKSAVLYWYSLGIVLFALGVTATLLTITIGDAINWAGRIGFYLMGAYFIIAVLSRDTRLDRDISVPEKWAEAFRSDPKQVSDLFANMTSGFVYGKIITDTDGKPIDIFVLDMNPAYESIMGVKKQNAVGRRATEVLPVIESEVSEWLAPYARAAIGGESVTLERRSPSIGKWNRITVYSPHKGYFVSIIDDITERKKAEESLKRSNEELRHFAYISSHDLQEPLRMVASYLGLLERRYQGKVLDEQVMEYIGFASEGAMRMKELINDLLSYTRVESQAKLFAEVDMNEAFGKAKENLSVSIEANHARVEGDKLPIIMADETQMTLLLQNLISNAIKFHDDKPPDVRVTYRENWREYTFAVKDHGYRNLA